MYSRDNIYRFLQTKHCFLGYFAHFLNHPPPQKKKNTLFLQQKVASMSECLLKIIGRPFFRRRLPRRPRGFIALAINSMIHDYHRLIGWEKTTEAGKQLLWGGGELLWLVDVGGWRFCSDSLVLLFFFCWFICFLNSINESPGTHRNMPCKFFFDQTCFVDSSENLKPLTQLEGFKQKNTWQ